MGVMTTWELCMFQVGPFVSLMKLQMEDLFFGQKETGAKRVAHFVSFVMDNYGARFQEHCFNISRDIVFFFSILQFLEPVHMEVGDPR